MSKNFKKPAPSSHHVQSQIQQNGNNSTPGVYSSNGASQFKGPFTPQPNAQLREQLKQGSYHSTNGAHPSGASPFSVPTPPLVDVPTAPLPAVPTTPFVGVSATPFFGIPPGIVDPRIHKQVEQYAQWLQINNKLPVSQERIQAYQDSALEITQVGKREVRTFAPFQEHSSALHVMTSDQFTMLAMLVVYWLVGLVFLHLAMLTITLGFVTLLYICGFITSGMLATNSFRSSSGETIDEEVIHALDQLGVEWPTYTILCPLYKEAAIVPQFVQAMKALHYPIDKLQVLFLTEEADSETRTALYSMQLPASFTILTVPQGTPQTKPRACNFGLLQAKGQFIVIFDAEDKPELYQLKKAVLAFANLGPEVACVQAKLNYYNSRQNLLTRWFTAEYSTWFDIMLPGLQRTGFSLPLGGTSNHFRTEVLRALGGWDAFNVTEDCDLGLRISQYGLKTAVLDSTTYEEATSRVRTWLFQRSRWIKGYLQTYLVHMRHPLQTLRRGHVRKFCSLQLIVGAWTFVLFLNPFMWALTLLYILFHPVKLYGPLFPGPILYAGAFCLIFGNFFYVYIHLIGCLRRQEYTLVKWVLLIPLYWVLMSISAYIALYQLIVKPHYWEKTQHGTHLALATRVQVRGFLPAFEPGGYAVAASMPTTRLFAVTIGRVFKRAAAPNTLETPTRRVRALRRTLSTQLGQHKIRRQMHLPRVRDLWLVATVIIACITSIGACWYFFQQHEVLLYVDAYSHMRIARSAFDSVTPGLAQLGGVWLPLPHVLMWPFIWDDYLWHSGLAGSFVGMISYIATVVYLYLSIRRITHSSRLSFLGSLLFIFNPNVLYLQSTPLSELTCFWTLTMACYYFLVWTQEGTIKYLVLAAISTFIATLTRYDGWPLFMALLVLVIVIGLFKKHSWKYIQGNSLLFCTLGGLGILLWLIWNKVIFGDPLYFQHSQYSSQAAQLILLQSGGLYAYHNVWLSVKTYILDVMYSFGDVLTVAAVLAFVIFFIRRRLSPSMLATLAFITPFGFYILSLYTGQAVIWVPGAVPANAPIQLFNVRYGAEMVVPASFFIATLMDRIRFWLRPHLYLLSQIAFVVVLAGQSIFIASNGIISLQDGLYGLSCASVHPINAYLAQHYAGGRILQDVTAGDFSLSEAGIDFKNVVYVGSGALWDKALTDPADTVQWIVIVPKDVVSKHINVNDPAFLSRFSLVVQESAGLRLYHRKDEPPLPTRPLPPGILTDHRMCPVGYH